MRSADLIRKKRDGLDLSQAEIESLVSGYVAGNVPDYQMAAWLMAAWIRGLSDSETAVLTESMMRSGEVLEWPEIKSKKVDKHSTGGVGDKTSLIVAPIVAAGGVAVPMISGRGLGHTGGTLDKLQSIPGFRVDLSRPQMLAALQKCGCFITGQTEKLVPADKKIYALRDVTATVENVSLICASIMSKKLAAGLDGLVLDVKSGSGAFMKNDQDAKRLAELMVSSGERMGKRVVALITDMDQPLGRTIGNALEVRECVDILRDRRDPRSEDLRELSVQLAAWMFFISERSTSLENGRRLALELIIHGKASAQFRKMVIAQGGDSSFCVETKHLKTADGKYDVKSSQNGFLSSMDALEFGIASQILGAGRATKEDRIDPEVGIELYKKVGDPVAEGETLFRLYYNDESRLEEVKQRIPDAFSISEEKIKTRPLVREIIQSGNIPLSPTKAAQQAG